MIAIVLIVAAVGFVVYAALTQYKNTLPSDSIPKRVWASVMAAGAAVATAAMTWLHGVTAP